MNHLDQLVRETFAERAEHAPDASAVIARALDGGATRRRRFPVLAAAVGTAAASAAVVTAVAWQADDPTDQVVGGSAAQPGAGVLELCLDLGAPALPAAHWGGGSHVVVQARSDIGARAVLMSADGTQWADCRLLNAAGDQGIVTTYPIAPAEPGAMGEFAGGGGATSFSMAERFPANVAEVHLEFPSGKTYAADAVNGFVVFQIDGDQLGGDGDPVAIEQYDDRGELVGGADLPGAEGDADLPPEQRSLIPAEPLDGHEVVDDQ